MKNVIRNTLDRRLHRSYDWPTHESPLVRPHEAKSKTEIASDMLYGGIAMLIGTTAVLALTINAEEQSESVRKNDQEWSVPLVD